MEHRKHPSIRAKSNTQINTLILRLYMGPDRSGSQGAHRAYWYDGHTRQACNIHPAKLTDASFLASVLYVSLIYADLLGCVVFNEVVLRPVANWCLAVLTSTTMITREQHEPSISSCEFINCVICSAPPLSHQPLQY